VELLLLAVAAFGVLVFLANRGRKSDIEKGVERTDPAWDARWLRLAGPLLLAVGILGALHFVSLDPSPSREYVSFGIHVTRHNQQNLIIVCGVLAVVGAILMLLKRR